jgi:predicted nucleic acid-binding protein
MLYFDSNYVLKCYLPEPGAHHVRALAARPVTKSCSRLGRAEVIAALHRKLREGSLTRPQLKAVWAKVVADDAAGVWTWLPFDGAVEHAVEQAFLGLGPKVFLRAGDAIHLATASLHGFAQIHSHDQRVLDAAAAFGLTGVDVIP